MLRSQTTPVRTLQRRSVLGIVLGCLLIGPTSAEAPLRWKLKPAEKLEILFSQNMDIEMSVLGNKVHSTVDMTVTMGWQVESITPEKVAKIRQRVQRVQMKMSTPPGIEASFDSDAQQELTGVAEEIAKGIRPMVGLEFIQEMSDRGEILSVELTPESAAALKKLPSAPQLEDSFSKDGLKSMFAQSAAVLPPQAIEKGFTWKGLAETKSPVGAMVINMDYVYQGPVTKDGKELQKIDTRVNVGMAAPAENSGMKIEIVEQEGSGEMYFDAVNGRFAQSDMTQLLVMKIVAGQMTQEQRVTTTSRMTFAPAPDAVTTSASKAVRGGSR